MNGENGGSLQHPVCGQRCYPAATYLMMANQNSHSPYREVQSQQGGDG